MSFCTNCGKELNEEDNFCTRCGHQVAYAEEVDVDDAGDEDLDKDFPSDCYATFSGRMVSIVRSTGSIYRRITVPRDIVTATVSGDRVSVVCEGGWLYLYSLNGNLIRICRN